MAEKLQAELNKLDALVIAGKLNSIDCARMKLQLVTQHETEAKA